MQCHLSSIKLTTKSLLLGLLLSASFYQATKADDFETIDRNITETLKRSQPTSVITYEEFKLLFFKTLTNFVDTSNRDPLATHVDNMQQHLTQLEQKIETNFVSVKPILERVKAQLRGLITLLRSYNKGGSPMILGAKLLAFASLLPSQFKSRVNLAVLKHRLSC